MVEAQHHVATLKLVDSLAEQRALEDLIEASKPAVPPECRHLDYLLHTPFRYGPYRTGSRFRRAGLTEGVFYAAETPATAVAEIAFHRLLFFAESPDTPWPVNAAEYTCFAAAFATKRAIDLTGEPFAASHGVWMHPTEYGPCQTLADVARGAGVEAIRYASVRDPGAHNLALLTCRVFTRRRPVSLQTWRIHLGPHGAQAICEAPRLGLSFDRASLAADPRIAALRWERS
jgi:RES domain